MRRTASSYLISRLGVFLSIIVGWILFSDRDCLPGRAIVNSHEANPTLFGNARGEWFLSPRQFKKNTLLGRNDSRHPLIRSLSIIGGYKHSDLRLDYFLIPCAE